MFVQWQFIIGSSSHKACVCGVESTCAGSKEMLAIMLMVLIVSMMPKLTLK
jgi:hypothetical protein